MADCVVRARAVHLNALPLHKFLLRVYDRAFLSCGCTKSPCYNLQTYFAC